MMTTTMTRTRSFRQASLPSLVWIKYDGGASVRNRPFYCRSGASASNFRFNPMPTLSLPEKPAQSVPIADLSH
jgi:hypothetical protein